MAKDTWRQWANLLALLLTIGVNGLANALPLNGLNTGEISDRFQVFFVPAGYVFSIWGLIYFALLAFSIYQVLPSQRENRRLRRIGYWFVLSCLANSAWIFLWHYGLFLWTLLAMLVLLLSLIVIYLRLDINREQVSIAERWLVDVPFSLYLGWITVATIANVTDVLYYLEWNGWGVAPVMWAVIMLLSAVIIAFVVAWTRRDIAYLLVLCWAFVGIAIKQADVRLVATSALIAAGLVAGMVAWSLFRNLAHRQAT